MASSELVVILWGGGEGRGGKGDSGLEKHCLGKIALGYLGKLKHSIFADHDNGSPVHSFLLGYDSVAELCTRHQPKEGRTEEERRKINNNK